MLRIYDVSLEVVGKLVPVVAAIGRHDADLAKQLKRARSSISLNIAEDVPICSLMVPPEG